MPHPSQSIGYAVVGVAKQQSAPSKTKFNPMYEFIEVSRVGITLLSCVLFWGILFAKSVREESWRSVGPWILAAAAVIPATVGLGYLTGQLYGFSDATEGGMVGFGLAGSILAIFLVAHPLTNSAWYKQRVSNEPSDFPVTARLVKCIAGLSVGAMLLAAVLSVFPFPVGVRRLFLASRLIAAFAGVFVGCTMESRRTS